MRAGWELKTGQRYVQSSLVSSERGDSSAPKLARSLHLGRVVNLPAGLVIVLLVYFLKENGMLRVCEWKRSI